MGDGGFFILFRLLCREIHGVLAASHVPHRSPKIGLSDDVVRAEFRDESKGPLFRTIGRGTGKQTRTVLPQANAYRDDPPACCSGRHQN